MESTKKIYIMVSQTHTKFARVIRKIGKTKYNHVAIALDAELEQLYAFARPQHNGIFLARLVRESVLRYTLRKTDFVNVVIFQIDVTESQYKWVKNVIERIQKDKEYMYNLLSVLTYPISKGFSMYKAFTCIEFVMFILKGIDRGVTKPLCRYKPDDLVEILKSSVHFKGNLLDYKPAEGSDSEYFSPMSYQIVRDSAVAIKELCARSVFKHSTKYQVN